MPLGLSSAPHFATCVHVLVADTNQPLPPPPPSPFALSHTFCFHSLADDLRFCPTEPRAAIASSSAHPRIPVSARDGGIAALAALMLALLLLAVLIVLLARLI